MSPLDVFDYRPGCSQTGECIYRASRLSIAGTPVAHAFVCELKGVLHCECSSFGQVTVQGGSCPDDRTCGTTLIAIECATGQQVGGGCDPDPGKLSCCT